jgi:hypothetical protein
MYVARADLQVKQAMAAATKLTCRSRQSRTAAIELISVAGEAGDDCGDYADLQVAGYDCGD